MLDKETIKKIEDFVCLKPRSVHEIAKNINKNWRTIDRYISQIEKERGTISSRIFREGTRGALKIVYWSSFENNRESLLQDKLELEIMAGKKKEDFSPFDIFQYIDSKNKIIKIIKKQERLSKEIAKNIFATLKEAKSHVKIMSGNLSFINYIYNGKRLIEQIEEMARRNISIKIICRVDIAGIENVKNILAINHAVGKELIKIHHIEQPLRGIIIDEKSIQLNELKEATGKVNELDKKVNMIYKTSQKEWVDWLSNIFWKMFNKSIDSEKRVIEINKLK